MNKENFIQVLKRYDGSTLEDAEQIISLKDHYPYSQLLHALSARFSKDHVFKDHTSILQLAAVHAADRGVLKAILNAEFHPPSSSVQPVNSPEAIVQETTGQSVSADVADEIIHNLERLSELKHTFEMLYTDSSTISVKVDKMSEKPPEVVTPPEKESIKSKRARMIQMAKALNRTDSDEATKPPVSVIKSKNKKKDDPDLLHEIANKEELSLEGDRQKEQLEIIEQFIKIQPSISNAKDRTEPPPNADLSTIKTGDFGENIVSETLVEILLKQGKKEKAIEVLKKLIWKFPQKKAYFASQIEELKK